MLTCRGRVWSSASQNRWGSAVWSRLKRIRELELPSFRGWVTGALLRTRSDLEIAVFSIHNPTIKGSSYPKLLSQILDEIAQLKLNRPLILGGDFNLVSTGHRHSSEEIRTTKAEEELLKRIEQEFGAVSCWQCCRPGDPLPQTLRWTRNRAAAYHADALFVPKEWVQSGSSCDVLSGADWEKMSDHNPVFAQLKIPTESLAPTAT